MKRTILFILLSSLLIILLSNCAKEVPVIQRQVLFGNPDKASLKISPNGKHISFLAPVNGVLNVWVAPTDHPDEAQPVTADTIRGIRIYFWAYTGQHIIYLQDKEGDENWMVHVVNVQTKNDLNLTPFEEILDAEGNPILLPNGKKMRPRAQIQHVSHKFPDKILIGLNNRDPQYFDIYLANILTGDLKLIQKNTEFNNFLTDDDYNIHFAMKLAPDGGNEILASDGKGGWKTFTKIPMEDLLTTSPFGFDKTGEILYWIDSRGRNTAALTAMNLPTGKIEVLVADPRADIENIIMHPTEKNIQAASVNYTRVEWKILDKSIELDIEYLQSVVDGDVNVTSRSLDDKIWTVAYETDNGPVRYYLYDKENKKATFLFTNRKKLENLKLTKMHPVVIESRDGLKLVSYLSLPVWTDPDNDAKPNSPLPMVLFVHGGPWARDTWGYHSYHQWLANRGYAVLSVNYRSSTGFGKNFINAGNKEWSKKMHDDLIDAVNWAIKEGIAIKDRIAIMGGSYGGYATLVGLTFTPDVFVCGVDIVGPSNLKTLLQTIPPYWKPLMDLWATRVGDPRTEEGRKFLDSCSPLTYVNKINKPLLIGQGANDPRVKQSESDQIVKAMHENGIPVIYVLFPDEGHGFARPENRLSFNAVTDLFLAQYLGGRSEPIGDDFQGSSIEIKSGLDQIPGLKEAYGK